MRSRRVTTGDKLNIAHRTGITCSHTATLAALCLYVPLEHGTFNETHF